MRAESRTTTQKLVQRCKCKRCRRKLFTALHDAEKERRGFKVLGGILHTWEQEQYEEPQNSGWLNFHLAKSFASFCAHVKCERERIAHCAETEGRTIIHLILNKS